MGDERPAVRSAMRCGRKKTRAARGRRHARWGENGGFRRAGARRRRHGQTPALVCSVDTAAAVTCACARDLARDRGLGCGAEFPRDFQRSSLAYSGSESPRDPRIPTAPHLGRCGWGQACTGRKVRGKFFD